MPKTLLLADDSVTIQKVVGITFANEDVTLVTVDNGDDAIIRARQIKPDCVLADVSMPGLSGYELCAAIRAEPELAHIPVLLLTGTFETYDSARAGDAGADGYIAKPFEAQALVERVRGLLAKPRAVAPPPAPPKPEPVAAPQPQPIPQPQAPRPPEPQPMAAPAPAPIAPQRPVTQPQVPRPPTPVPSLEKPSTLPRVAPPPPPPPPQALEASTDDLGDIPEDSLSGFGDVRGGNQTLPATRIFDSNAGGMDTPVEALFGNDLSEPRNENSQPSGDLLDESSFPDPQEEALARSATLDAEDFDEPATPDTTAPDESPLVDAAAKLPAHSAAPSDHEDEGEEPELPWAEALELDDPESDDSLAAVDFAPREPLPELGAKSAPITPPQTPVVSPPAPAPSAKRAPASAPAAPVPAVAPSATPPSLDSRAVREALEKVAWEAFGPLSEQLVREVVSRVEAIAWEIVPQLAERLIREEIAALKKESS